MGCVVGRQVVNSIKVQILCGTSHEPREDLWTIKIGNKFPEKVYFFWKCANSNKKFVNLKSSSHRKCGRLISPLFLIIKKCTIHLSRKSTNRDWHRFIEQNKYFQKGCRSKGKQRTMDERNGSTISLLMEWTILLNFF